MAELRQVVGEDQRFVGQDYSSKLERMANAVQLPATQVNRLVGIIEQLDEFGIIASRVVVQFVDHNVGDATGRTWQTSFICEGGLACQNYLFPFFAEEIGLEDINATPAFKFKSGIRGSDFSDLLFSAS